MTDQTSANKTKTNDSRIYGDSSGGGTSFLGYLREWLDAGVIAIVLAMFIRTFVVELFKIPSGSMSPTLLGDTIAEGNAFDKDGKRYDFLLILDPNAGASVQVFRKNEKNYMEYRGREPMYALTTSLQQLASQSRKREEHRILVNKFAYWFKPPARGDIIVFRVPFELKPTHGYERNGYTFPGKPYIRSQSVYVKRCVALPGERVEIRSDGHLYVNEKQITDPEVIAQVKYNTTEATKEYDIVVPPGHVLAMGDNSDNSLDSRYWGPLPMDLLRGKAIARYSPVKKARFLNN